MKNTIFENKTEMPGPNDPGVVRTAQTRVQMHQNYEPAMNIPDKDMSVVNAQRPRRGHGY